jgi:hypothetical protein
MNLGACWFPSRLRAQHERYLPRGPRKGRARTDIFERYRPPSGRSPDLRMRHPDAAICMATEDFLAAIAQNLPSQYGFVSDPAAVEDL